MNERTVKCDICGEPYKVIPYLDIDQSACPDCVAKADKKMGAKGWENRR